MVQRDGTYIARRSARAVLRLRDGALALVLLPAVLWLGLVVAGAPAALCWAIGVLGVGAPALAGALWLVTIRVRPVATPTIDIPEHAGPALHELVRELAASLKVPPPSGVALTPDCDSWLEEPPDRRGVGARLLSLVPAALRPGRAEARAKPRAAAFPEPRGVGDATAPHASPQTAHEPTAHHSGAPVLVIGSPFLWWMRVAELRALLAPVVAGTEPSAQPDIAAARRCVRAWDATLAVADSAPASRPLLRLAGWACRLLLRAAGEHSGAMERGVAAAASARAQTVDYGLRIVAQEQVGLAYAGWDRLLTRVALPAWRTGRWPRHLDAGVAAALTELSRRDRLAERFASRLGERPACDLLEEPGAVDEAISLLAARLFHGIPDSPAAEWAPVDWTRYPEEVVDRIWRDRAARLFAALDAAETPTLACAVQRLADTVGGEGWSALATRLSAAAYRSQAIRPARPGDPAGSPGGDGPLALPLEPPSSEHDLLVAHVAAAVCCAAADTTAAAPGLDWLDGPVLIADGGPRKDLTGLVQRLVDDGDPGPLRAWLAQAGVRSDKPVRLV